MLHTVPEMEDQLALALAGTAAGDAVLGSISTTSEDDVERASAIARDMVGIYGMSESIGRVKVLSRQVKFLGGDGIHLEAVSAATVAAFDGEVRQLVEAAEVRAKQIISANARTMDAMVQRLQTEETLEGPALVQLLAPVEPAPNVKGNGNRRQGISATAGARHEGADA